MVNIGSFTNRMHFVVVAPINGGQTVTKIAQHDDLSIVPLLLSFLLLPLPISLHHHRDDCTMVA
jgi:hypothetical protein